MTWHANKAEKHRQIILTNDIFLTTMSKQITAKQFTRSLSIQKSVVFALFLRELNTRFGRYRLGYFWALLEPLALIVILSSVRVLFGQTTIEGVAFPLFFAAGILPYLFFTHSVNLCLGAVEANHGLMNYQRVKPADAVFTRLFLEALIMLIVGVVLFGLSYYIGYSYEWNSTLQTACVIFLTFIFCSGLGLIVSVVGPLWQDSKKFIPALIRPLFFISGIFFSANMVPENLRDLALLNPLMQMTELIRMSMFLNFTSNYGDFFYFSLCAFVSLFSGLFIYRLYHIKLMTSGNIR